MTAIFRVSVVALAWWLAFGPQIVIRNTGDPDNAPRITTSSLSNGTLGQAYSATLQTESGVGRTPFTWSVSTGSLPSGLSLNTSTGAITGTPSSAGSSSFTIRVVDALGHAHSQSFTLTVDAAGGITCSELGVTCLRETSFTSAQGWSSPPYTQVGDGAPDCATFPGSAGSGFSGKQTGFGDSGGWDASGYCAQVTTDANYSGGAGGAGFRTYRGNGQNVISGGMSVSFASSTTLYFRVFIRYQSGFAWVGSAPSYIKDLYIGSCGSGCMIYGYQGGGWGWNYNGSDNIPSSSTWSNLMGGTTGDGQWHCHEGRFTKNGGSGTVQVWIDGTQVLNTTHSMGSAALSSLLIGENQHNVTGASPVYFTDYDDFAISATARIGGTGCGS